MRTKLCQVSFPGSCCYFVGNQKVPKVLSTEPEVISLSLKYLRAMSSKAFKTGYKLFNVVLWKNSYLTSQF